MEYTIEQQIEFLCEREFPDYAAVKADRVRALAGMSVPGSGPQAGLWGGPHSRGRKISPEEQKALLEKVVAFKEKLRALKPEEVSSLFLGARNDDWRAQYLTIEEAAEKIAYEIFPGEDYPWEVEQRSECAAEYRIHLKEAVLSGQVPFVNPHRKTRFDHTFLTADRFPDDGLIRKADLHICLLPKHRSKGYFASPKPISKAPAPISPLRGISTASLTPRLALAEPDWEKWRLMDKVRLWKATCLAVNIEPPQENKADLWEEVQLKGLPARFQKVWEIVNADHFFSRLNEVGTAGRMLHQVDIGWFALWATTKGLDIPAPLAAIAARFKSTHELSAATIAKAKLPDGTAAASGLADPEETPQVGGVQENNPPAKLDELAPGAVKIKKAALIKKYRQEWPSAENDIAEASRNKLSAAKLERGYYNEQKAIAWAKAQGKFDDRHIMGTAKASPFDSLHRR